MKRFVEIFTSAAVVLFALVAFALIVSAQPTLNGSLGAITNNQPGTSEFVYGIGGDFTFRKLTVGLDVFGDPTRTNPKQLTRGRAFAAWKLYEGSNITVWGGGGGYKTGNETGGFGQIGLSAYKRFHAFGRYGSENFTEADGYYDVLHTDRFGFGPFYRYTRLQSFPNLHQAGFRFTLR